VITYREGDAADLCAGLAAIAGRHARPIQEEVEDNIAKTADWLLAIARGSRQEQKESLVRV
jgi:hypothetical protein